MPYDRLAFACDIFPCHQQNCQGSSVHCNIPLTSQYNPGKHPSVFQNKLMVFVPVSGELSTVTQLAKLRRDIRANSFIL